MVTSRERRHLLSEGRQPPSAEDVALDRYVGGIVQGIKAKLSGWDATLLLSCHSGDGSAQIKQASTLPPPVAAAVLRGLVAGDDAARPARDRVQDLIVAASDVGRGAIDLSEAQREALISALSLASLTIRPAQSELASEEERA